MKIIGLVKHIHIIANEDEGDENIEIDLLDVTTLKVNLN